MATVLTPAKPQAPSGGGPPPPPPPSGSGGWGGGGGPDEGARTVARYRTGTWLGLCAVVMLFAAFASAYVVRRGASNDWRPLQIPPVLWLNTAVLLASSVTIEQARRRVGPRQLQWLAATALLGGVFLAGQYAAWLALRAAGVYVASNPSSSFFYLLTGAHGLHLAGGVAALWYASARAWLDRGWTKRKAAVEATALYWHFMDGLWIFVILLLVVGR